jgi:type II secretory pathway predicted ATPase ExeA
MHGTLSRPPEAGDDTDPVPGRAGGPGRTVRDPFLNRPSPDLFFAAEPHRAAWTFLRRTLRRGDPLVLLTGDFGAGKTMLTLRLVRAIRDREIGPCVHMSTPAEGAAAVLRRTAHAAGLDPATLPEDAAGLAASVHAHLSADPPGQRVFLVLEDPQDLEADALEHLLRAVPAASGGRAPLTAVLIGHASLQQLLRRARFRRFDARIRKRHQLAPMDSRQTRAYIAFRMAQGAGADTPSTLPAFDDAALQRVFELTRGNPREINNVCGTSLSQAIWRRKPRIDREMVDEAARALGRPGAGPGHSAPVVVAFLGGSRASRPARGCPDYVRTGQPPWSGTTEAQAAAPAASPPADGRGGRARSGPPGWAQRAGRDRRLRAAAAGAVVLLAAGYLAAPYLGPPRPGPDGSSPAPTAADGAATTGLNAAERREVESLLRSLDFETGAVDGDIDATTRDAVQAYKRMAGLSPADRTIGPDLLADLRAVTGNLDADADAGAGDGAARRP